MTDFTVTIHGTYTREEIPPRCRKPRPVTHAATTTATVQAVSAEEAPVAFRVHQVIPEGHVTQIRTHDGRLYAPYKPVHRQEEPTVPGDPQFPSEVDDRHQLYRLFDSPTNAEDFAAKYQQRFAGFLIIDGTVWAQTDEPGYLVTTFGMGGGHGSTGLMVSSRKDHGTLFRADEFEQARAYAAEVSRERGDRADRYDDEQAAEQYRAIEVLIPEAVTLVTVPPTPKAVRDLRRAYSSARDRLSSSLITPDEETEAFGEVVRLREEIIKTGHAPIDPDMRPYEARDGHQEAMQQ